MTGGFPPWLAGSELKPAAAHKLPRSETLTFLEL